MSSCLHGTAGCSDEYQNDSYFACILQIKGEMYLKAWCCSIAGSICSQQRINRTAHKTYLSRFELQVIAL
jgi:hypothetical protein